MRRYFLVDKDYSIEVNDNIDEVIFGGDSDSSFVIEERTDGKGIVKDEISSIKEGNQQAFDKKEALRLQREKDLNEREERENKRIKKLKRLEKRKKLWSYIAFPFLPKTWVSFIRLFEELWFTLFVDSQIIFPLLSLVYLSYIIISYDGKLEETIVKGVGAVIVCLLCVILQMFTNNNKQGK